MSLEERTFWLAALAQADVKENTDGGMVMTVNSWGWRLWEPLSSVHSHSETIPDSGMKVMIY